MEPPTGNSAGTSADEEAMQQSEASAAFIQQTLDAFPPEFLPAKTHQPVTDIVPDPILGEPRLPYDVLGTLAEILANSAAFAPLSEDHLRSLAYLNRVSRAVHQVTLPLLYRNTVYRTEEGLFASLSRGIPKGFKHTKCLYVTSATFKILLHQLRLVYGHFDRPDHSVGMRAYFPRLELICVSERDHLGFFATMENTITVDAALHVDMCKNLSISDLVCRCAAFSAKHPTATQVRIFGTHFELDREARRHHFRTINIASMHIRKGAGILQEHKTGARLRLGESRKDVFPNRRFSLVIDDEEPSASTELAVEVVLQMAMMNWRIDKAERREQRNQNARFKLHCWPKVLDVFTRILHNKQPLSITIAVEIRGHQTTGTDMARHVKAFAASYSRWWTYQRHRRDAEFVMLNAAIPIPSRLVRVDNEWKPLKIRVTGYLWGGDVFHADPQGNPAVGFTAHAEHWIELPKGESVAPRGETVSDYQEYFPCGHVRVPADW